jgi:hypothetical protein
MLRALPLLLVLLASCIVIEDQSNSARYLYVWAGDKDERESDFLAVVDVHSPSQTYGQVIATVPVGMTGTLPHHMEYQLPDSSQLLFVNGHHHERLFLFDTKDAAHPRLELTVAPPSPLRFPHDMIRMPNGNVLVSYLRSDGPSPLPGDSTTPGGHGGIAELSPAGEVLRSVSAADSAFTVPIRPYSFAMRPDIDRMLSTGAAMMEDTSADVVQIWKLSTLERLSTIQVPPVTLPGGRVLPGANMLPFEPRVMGDGSVLFNAYGCAFYRVTNLEADKPTVTHVYTIDVPEAKLGACGVPIVTTRFWVMTVGQANLLVTLDISDPARPKEVARLAADSSFRPHWLAADPGSDRVIVGAENGGENRMLMARFNQRTGGLSWDSTFRSGNGELGLSFQRTQWPHGASGEAFGHAALFRR